MQQLGQISLLVHDYDEAIDWYRQKLDWELLEDTQRSPTKRWIRMAPRGGNGASLLFMKAKNAEQKQAIGNQTGGRVFLFLYTDDFWTDYHRMHKEGVEFIAEPREEAFGTVVVFKDLYGNLYDFIQRK